MELLLTFLFRTGYEHIYTYSTGIKIAQTILLGVFNLPTGFRHCKDRHFIVTMQKNTAGNLTKQKKVLIFVLKLNDEVMRTANYTELRNSLKSYLDGVANDSEPLLVHRSGNASVVILSLDEYNSMKETEYIMKSPAMMDVIRKGQKEIAAGRGKVVKIDELWK